jgi:subtilase family serine protease
LFAAYDAAPDLTVAAPTAVDGNPVTLSSVVSNRGSATATGVTVAFSNGTKILGTSAPITLAPGRSVKVSIRTGALPEGTQVVTAIADPADKVAESNEGNNRTSGTVRT